MARGQQRREGEPVTTWHYERGTWTETTFLDDAWQGEKDWGDVRGRLGYEERSLSAKTSTPSTSTLGSQRAMARSTSNATIPIVVSLIGANR